MQVITGDMKWKEALQQGVINVAANTAGELAANEIGKLYDAGKGLIGYVEHKVRHIVLGSVEGLIMGHRDPLKGFISGGIAAGGAEIIAEGLPSTMSMQARKNVVLMTAGVGAFLLRGDVNVAAMAASNAFENNFAMSETLPALTPAIPVMEWLGLAGLGAAATVAASAMGLATGGFAGGNYLANQSEQNPALGEIWVDSDSYYGPVKSKLTSHESRPSVLSTPGFEYDPIIFSTPLTERRSSVLATPVADFPVWKEGFTQWKGPIFQNVTPVADNMPNTTVLANTRHAQKTSAVQSASNDAFATAAADRVAAWELKHNKKAVQNMTDRELAQSLADRAERKIGSGKGPLIGQQKHKYNERLFNRYQGMTDERSNITVEARFKGGNKWQEGMGLKDSVQADWYDDITEDALDYKFGDAKVTSAQVKRYQKQLPRKADMSPANVIEVKPSIKSVKKGK